MTTPKSIRILIVGTGGMANSHAQAYQKIPGVEVVAGVDVRTEQLAAFNQKYGIPNGFSSVEEAIAWGQFDAASNVTPDRFHFATTMPLLAAGKHVLCEKPLATNASDAVKMAEAAAEAGVVNAINLTYRNVAAMQRAAEFVRAGEIGEVRFFEASYLQSWLHQPAWGDWRTKPAELWRLSSAHGSKGALGDLGVHIVDFATYIAGLDVTDASGRFVVFDKAPPDNKIGEYVLDANDTVTMQLSLENRALGTVIATRVASGHHNDLRLKLYGTKGALEVLNQEPNTLRACFEPDLIGPNWKTIECPSVTTNHERFIAAIRGEAGPRAPDFARGAAVQKVLDAAELSAGQNAQVIRV